MVRLALAPFGEYATDVDGLGAWAVLGARHGPGDFYAVTGADHLPGDLWLLWLVGQAFKVVSPHGEVGGPTLDFMIKLVPILADVAVAALLYAIGRTLAGARAGLVAAALYAFNPAPIFLSSIWGQWDSVSAAFLLLGVWCFLRGWIVAALPALTYAALIKPQLALVGAVALIGIAVARNREAQDRGLWRQVGLGALLSAVLVVAVTVPFDSPPWPGDHDLFDRARVALELYKDPTVSAFNFWSFWTQTGKGGGSDLRSFALGIDYRVWGLALLGIAIALTLVRLAQRPDGRRIVWACTAAALALFVLPTRVHERYLLPAVALAAVLAAVERRYRAVAVLLSLSLFANLYWSYDLVYPLPSLPLLTGSSIDIVWAIANVGALAALLLFPPAELARSGERDGCQPSGQG